MSPLRKKQIGRWIVALTAAVAASACALPVRAGLPRTTAGHTARDTQKKSAGKSATGHTGSASKTAANAKSSRKPAKTISNSATSTHKSSSTAATATSRSGKTSSKKGAAKRTKRVRGQEAPTSDRIGEIQAALARNHMYEGEPTGAWDDATVQGMKRFQATHGLNATGRLDAQTLQKLGLGSSTAGLGAPITPANAAANRLLSSSNTIQSTQPE